MKKILQCFSAALVTVAVAFFFCLVLQMQGFAQIVVINPVSPWVVPAGVTSIKVEVWGGGGAGGGCQSLAPGVGSGGGGGAYNKATFSVLEGESYTIIRGAGGTGGSDASGGPGTASSVSGPGGAITANPGLGGARRSGAGGAGGTGGFSNGGTGGTATSNGGGGGGAAGNAEPAFAGNGGNGSNTAAGTAGLGNPNVSPYIGGAGAAAQTGNGGGAAGISPGGGGAGGKSPFFNGSKSGGNGAAGQVIITYCNTYSLTSTSGPLSVCISSATASLTVTAGYLPVGSYIVTYNRSLPAATGLTATMTATIDGTGAFTVTGLTSVGSSDITITNIASATSSFCSNSISENNVASINVDDAATVYAGSDQIVCGFYDVSLAGNIAGIASSATWTGGAGSFNPGNTDLNAIYTPSASERNAGSVNLTLTTDDPAGACPAVSDQVLITIKSSPTAVSASPAIATICTGTSTPLTAAATISSLAAIANEKFNINGTYTYTAAGSNSGGGTAFSQQASGYAAGLTAITNNDASRFMIAVASSFTTANTSSTLTSPIIPTTAYNTLTLTFRHTYAKGSEAGVSVQVSTDGGSNWANVNPSGAIIGTNTYTGNQGANNNFANATFNLGSFINQPNFRLRFNFVSNVVFATSWWAIDDVALNGIPLALFSWTADTGPGINGLPSGAGTALASNKNISVNPTGNTTYTLTAQNPLTSCTISTATAVVTVNQNSTLTQTSAAGTESQVVCLNTAYTDMTCAIGGGATSASMTAGALPSGLTGNFDAGVFTISGIPTETGTFIYTITATGTCNHEAVSGSITVPVPLTSTYTKTNKSACNPVNDGSLTVIPAGGTPPYTCAWTGELTGGSSFSAGNETTLSGLGYGFYHVTVNDAKGCEISTINNMHIENAYYVYITNNGSISALCANTGSILLYGNAGVKPYTYSMDGSNYQASNTFENLGAGTYTCYVKDAAGCVSTKSITVGAAAPVEVTYYAKGSSSCANDGSIELYRTGGIGPYTYSLDGSAYQSSNKFTDLSAGVYTGYVKDSKGCTGSLPGITVTQGLGLTVTAGKSNTGTCLSDGSFQLRQTGGIPPYAYSIDDINYQSSSSFTGLAASTYTGWVKDSRGCKGSVNVTINLNPITVIPFVVNSAGCAASTGKITLFRSGGTGPYTYSLDGNNYQSSNIFTDLFPGTYDGFVKDSKTCVGAIFGIEVGPACVAPNTKTSAKKRQELDNTVNGNLVLQAYPNPTASGFTLWLKNYRKGRVSITITDVLGRKVFMEEGTGKQLYRFGNNFRPGIYKVCVINENEKQYTVLVKE